jgi:heat shock protein HslJ
MRSWRTPLLSAVGAAALLALIPATTLVAQDAPQDITGIDWQLTSIAVDGTLGPVSEGVTPTLRLDAGDASGSAGCNQFSGGYELEGQALTFEALTSTLMLCEDPQAAVEGAYLEALPRVATYALASDGVLSLLDAEGAVILEYAAAASGEGAASPIEGVTWLLTQQSTDGTLADLPADILVSMRLEGGAAGGAGGCNSWFGSYTIEGDAISFTDIGSTLMACGDPADTVERTFFANLEAAATFTADDASLTIAAADGTTILGFEADEPGTVIGSWVATAIDMNDGVVSSETTSAVTATFAEDGTLSGNDGCNSYDATYEIDGPTIAIGPLAATRMACVDDALTEQAAAYAEALASAATWSVDPAGSLQLRDAGGALLVSYAPAEG